ncbi:MAG: hypothetical protein Q8P67_06285, partial [archaeon]|nr:hypothetical protein [archaeon]
MSSLSSSSSFSSSSTPLPGLDSDPGLDPFFPPDCIFCCRASVAIALRISRSPLPPCKGPKYVSETPM